MGPDELTRSQIVVGLSYFPTVYCEANVLLDSLEREQPVVTHLVNLQFNWWSACTEYGR